MIGKVVSHLEILEHLGGGTGVVYEARIVNRSTNQESIYVSSVLPDSAVKVIIGEPKKMQNDPACAGDLKNRITMLLTGFYTQRETNSPH